MTADEINALPDLVRRYIHDLETRCDPTGEVQQIHSLLDQREGLLKKIRRLDEVRLYHQRAALRRKQERDEARARLKDVRARVRAAISLHPSECP